MTSFVHTVLDPVVLPPTFANPVLCSQARPSPSPSPTDDNTVVHGSALSLIQSFRFAPQVQNLDAEPRGRRVIEAASGVKLTATSTGFAMTSPPLSRKLAAKQARLTLPARLDAGFTVLDEGTKLGIDVKLAGATSSEGKIAETGLLVYENGLGQGRHVVHRPHAEGIEDYVVFEQRPEVEELRYEVRVPAGASLRLVSNVLEVVDENGAPRLRMTAPVVVQKDGVQVVPTVRVEGCAVDVDARLPWGRPVTAPGAEVCSVVVEWAAATYPVVVDPAWTTTGAMKTVRVNHTATLLPSGKVLVAGGQGDGEELASMEVYDPGTGTWTSGSSMKAARTTHTATLLPSGKVLVAGGFNTSSKTLASVEMYDPASNTWASGPRMKTERTGHTATALAGGKVLVAGGLGQGYKVLASVEVYDPATGAWSSRPGMKKARRYHTATLLLSGKVLVAGGGDASVEVYDPATGTWTSGSDMTTKREWHTATLLPSGNVLVAGGYGAGASTEVYDPATGKWSSGGDMSTKRVGHTATRLPSGRVLVAGGGNGNGSLASSEAYDPVSNTWTSGPGMKTERTGHTATLLPSGNVLVGGGQEPYEGLASAEVYDPASNTWSSRPG